MISTADLQACSPSALDPLPQAASCGREEETVLLDRYYAAGERAVDDLEARLMDLVDPWARRIVGCQQFQRADQEDCLAIARHRLLLGLRAGREGGRRVEHLIPWARQVVGCVIAEEKRRGTPMFKMKYDIWYVVTKSPHRGRFAHWKAGQQSMLGLASQRGWPFRETPAYTRFRENPCHALAAVAGAPRPADLPSLELWDLMYRTFAYIQTPLRRNLLAEHLMKIKPPPSTVVHSLDDLEVVSNLLVEGSLCSMQLHAPLEEVANSIREALCALPYAARTAVLLSWEPALLTQILGSEAPWRELAEALDAPPDEIGGIWPYLPLSDDGIAARLQTTRGNVHTLRSRGLHRAAQRLREAGIL
jgi:hypothetical protein